MTGKGRHPKVVASPLVHVVGPGKLKIVNGRLAFATDQGVQLAADLQHLRQLICYGPVGVSDEALKELLLRGVQVSFLSYRGANFRGTLSGPVPHAIGLRKLQHRVLADDNARFELAKAIVARKVASQVEGIRKLRRQLGEDFDTLHENIRRLRHSVDEATRREQLLGIEGSASVVWFQAFGKALQAPWVFSGRNRRPPQDAPNALLSLGYTMLANRMHSRCLADGLETALGALHEERPGRPALVCDLVEPLRVPVVDQWLLRILNNRIIKPGDFHTVDGGLRLKPDAFARFIGEWEAEWARMRHNALLERTIRWFIDQLRFHIRRLSAAVPEGNNGTVRGGV